MIELRCPMTTRKIRQVDSLWQIGIRPVINGRFMGIRESLKGLTYVMASIVTNQLKRR